MRIRTGAVSEQAPRGRDTYMGVVTDVVVTVDDTPVDRQIYPSNKPHTVFVQPNEMALITLYNSTPDTNAVHLKKVLMSQGANPKKLGTGCCATLILTESDRLAEVHIPTFFVDYYSPIFILKTPGLYELDFSGEPPPDIRVTAVKMDMQEVNQV